MIPGGGTSLLAFSTEAQLQVSRSLRFDTADSSRLTRTFGTPNTQATFTFSAWVKRTRLGVLQHLFAASTNNFLSFTATDALNLTFSGVSALTTATLLRDMTAWCHVVWSQSGTSHLLYVNGTQVGSVTATSGVFNSAIAHEIGSGNATQYLSAYLADVWFIDGQALTPSSFAKTSITGLWVPVAYQGTSPGNSFHLDFADNSALTATAIGKDSSGNSNNWTPAGLSITAGVSDDALLDTPTSYGSDTGLGGELRGNYATLDTRASNAAQADLSAGNLTFSRSFANSTFILPSTFAVGSGKWYAEYTVTAISATPDIGVMPATTWIKGFSSAAQTNAPVCNAGGYSYVSNGNKGSPGGTTNAYGTSWGAGNVVGVALDATNGTLTFYNNGVSQGVAFSGLPVQDYLFVFGVTKGGTSAVQTISVNFGQRAFTYAAPAGYKALCDANLPYSATKTSGTFTGNAAADGPVIWLGGVPTAMTINGSVVTFGATGIEKLATGFKVSTASALFNASGANTYSLSSAGPTLRANRAQVTS